MQTGQMMNKENVYNEGGPMPVIRLKEKGITQADINKLIDSGYQTVDSVAMATKKALLNVKGVSENKAEKLMELARQYYPIGFIFQQRS